MRIHVHRASPQKADSRQAEIGGKFDGQTRSGGNRSHDQNAAPNGLWRNLKAQPAADHHDRLRKRQPADESCPQNLVDRIVATDIFTKNQQTPLVIEQAYGVNSTSAFEVRLSLA